MRWTALILLLSGCRFAQVRYHGGAEASPVLACFPDVEQPARLECWDYMDTKLRQRAASTRL
jgi:hypothetical protein